MPGSSASSRQILLPLDLITDAADIGAACGHDPARALSIAKRRRTVDGWLPARLALRLRVSPGGALDDAVCSKAAASVIRHQTSLVSQRRISTASSAASWRRSAAAAWPSGLARALRMAARSSNCMVATK